MGGGERGVERGRVGLMREEDVSYICEFIS